jgi:hypothetical protein
VVGVGGFSMRCLDGQTVIIGFLNFRYQETHGHWPLMKGRRRGSDLEGQRTSESNSDKAPSPPEKEPNTAREIEIAG